MDNFIIWSYKYICRFQHRERLRLDSAQKNAAFPPLSFSMWVFDSHQESTLTFGAKIWKSFSQNFLIWYDYFSLLINENPINFASPSTNNQALQNNPFKYRWDILDLIALMSIFQRKAWTWESNGVALIKSANNIVSNIHAKFLDTILSADFAQKVPMISTKHHKSNTIDSAA